MQYGVMHNSAAPCPQKPTPVRLASHIVARVGRPSRFRSRSFMTVLAILGTICIILGRRNYVELEQLRTYLPTGLTDIIAQYGNGFQDVRWDDDAEHMEKIAYKKPKFHLLIPASNHTANLCKTILSAAILNYPPPTLVSYGRNDTSGMALVNSTYRFLLSKEAHDDDLILIVEEDAWFQLPAEVVINRFSHGMQDATTALARKYGKLQVPMQVGNDNDIKLSPKLTSKVLFGAAKECSNSPDDPACISPPQSPLPKDIYGPETDKHLEGKYNRPRYMGSTMVMGSVADLRPIYRRATEMLAHGNDEGFNSQQVFSRIFGEQEYARSLIRPPAPLSRSAKFLALFTIEHQNPMPKNFTLTPNKNYEYGITLDYFSSIFQTMNNSAEDVQLVSFNHPSVIASPSRISAPSFANPIHLPFDLNSTSPPFSQHVVSKNPNPPMTALDIMPGAEKQNSWSEIDLATNVIVPGSSVPVSLNFDGNPAALQKMWSKMWYYKYSRALMRQYMRSPDGPIAAEVAMAGGDKWWDLRGGKGGVWTDRGEWLEWNEVCGVYDDEVFGDGKGEFGYEDEDVGGQKVEYKFGKVVSGKEKKVETDDKEGDEGEDEGGDDQDNDPGDEGEEDPEEPEEELSDEEKISRASDKFKAELDKEDEEESEGESIIETKDEGESEGEGEDESEGEGESEDKGEVEPTATEQTIIGDVDKEPMETSTADLIDRRSDKNSNDK